MKDPRKDYEQTQAFKIMYHPISLFFSFVCVCKVFRKRHLSL